MNSSSIGSGARAADLPLLRCVREGIRSTNDQLPHLLKIALPYLVVSTPVAFLANGQLAIPGAMLGTMYEAQLVSTAAVLLTILLFAFATYVSIRLAAQQPLPAPGSQGIAQLWGFDFGFLRYLALGACLLVVSLALAANVSVFFASLERANPPSLPLWIARDVGYLFAALPQWIFDICRQSAVDFSRVLGKAFVVVGLISSFRLPNADILALVRGSLRLVRDNLLLWGGLAAIGWMVHGLTVDVLLRSVGSDIPPPLTLTVLISVAVVVGGFPMMLIYRAGYEASVAAAPRNAQKVSLSSYRVPYLSFFSRAVYRRAVHGCKGTGLSYLLGLLMVSCAIVTVTRFEAVAGESIATPSGISHLPLFYLELLLVSFFGGAVLLLALASVGTFVARIIGSSRRFGEVLRVAVVGLSPSLIVATVVESMGLSFPYADPLYLACAILYLVFGLRSAT